MQQISNIDIINDLDKQGKLRQLIKAGFFPCKMFLHRDIYFYVDAQIKSGVSKTEAVEMAQVQFNKDRSTIYRVLNSFA